MMGASEPPIPYQEVEWLQSDGYAYIITNIGNDVFNVVGNKIEWRGHFGYNTSYPSRRFVCASSSPARNFYFEINGQNKPAIGVSAIIDQILAMGTLYEGRLTILVGTSAQAEVLVNDTYVTASATTYITPISNVPFFLFRLTSSFAGEGQIIGTNKIYVNDVLLRDFVPVRVGTTGYMYDKVSGQLFGNAGTGDFILGNDK